MNNQSTVNQLQEIALRIREMREIADLTQTEMADKTEVTEEEYIRYENGEVDTDDSNWHWDDCDFPYDDENDVYIIPEGWWENRHFNPEDTFNCPIDVVVTHWMPLPEPPKEG